MLSRSTLLRLQGALQEHRPKWALRFVNSPGLSRSGSGSQVLHRNADSVEPVFVPFPGPSSSGDHVFGEHGHYNLSPPLSLPLGFLGGQLVHFLRWAVCLFWGAISGCDYVDHPESQEVLVSNEACLQFGR